MRVDLVVRVIVRSSTSCVASLTDIDRPLNVTASSFRRRAFSATRLDARFFSKLRSAFNRVFWVVSSSDFVLDRPKTVDVVPATAEIAVLVIAARAVIV